MPAKYQLHCGDCIEVMNSLEAESIDLIFADPPYHLSNDGVTCQSGQMVSVNKADWDKSRGFANDVAFTEAWLSACQRVLKPDGSLWVSGTYHNIYICGYVLQSLGFQLLNDISWFKPNASPNLSCRYFTASHETLLWVKKRKAARHTFHYTAMKAGSFPEDSLKNPDKQMRSVWSIPTTPKAEKSFGRHPTQKPIKLLERVVLASSSPGDLILDPFVGSGTTGVVALQHQRRFIGIDIEADYLALSRARLEAVVNISPSNPAPVAV